MKIKSLFYPDFSRMLFSLYIKWYNSSFTSILLLIKTIMTYIGQLLFAFIFALVAAVYTPTRFEKNKLTFKNRQFIFIFGTVI